MIEAILFDVGNTLMHSRVAQPAAALELAMKPIHKRLVELGFNPPAYEEYFRTVRRRFAWAYMWSRIVRRELLIITGLHRIHARMGIHLSLEQTADLYRKNISAIAAIFSFDDDATDVVARLHKAGLKQGLVSNTILPGFTIDEVLRNAGFLDYFPVRVYSSEVRYMKPSPKIFQLALDRLGVSAEQTLFVGDRVDNDVVGASRLGMRTVLFVAGDEFPREWDCADHTIRRLTEIPAIVGDQGG